MSTSQNESIRQLWLRNTLYALRGHFREKAPDDPDDLTLLPLDAESVIFRCSDPRVNEKRDLLHGRTESYEISSAGVVTLPMGPDGRNLGDLIRNNVDFATSNFPKIRNIIFIGHTYCGANDKLFGALTGSGAKVKPGSIGHSMLSLAPENLGEALQEAKKGGASDDELKRLVEQMTIMQSTRNLYDCAVGENKTVGDCVKEGKLHIVTAMRHLNKDSRGKLPLSVYDAKTQVFRSIEDLLVEAFPGKKVVSLEDIELAARAHHKPSGGLFMPTTSLEMQQGATTTTVTEYNTIGDPDIFALLEKIRSVRPSR